jgi:hypothetical protein
MNVEERFLSALRREQPDRVPVTLCLNPYGNDWYTRDPTYAGVLAACRELEADAVRDWYFPFPFGLTAAECPAETRTGPNGSTEHVLHTPLGPLRRVTLPDWRGGGETKRWISTPDDARRLLSIPYRPVRPDLRPFLKARAENTGRAVAQVTFPDPICMAGWIDPEALALWTVTQRDLLREMLDACFVRIRDALQYCLEGSVGPIYYFNGPEYALPPLMSPRDFDEFVVAYDRRLVEWIHRYPGRYLILHSHGRVSRFLERFAEIGMDGLNVLEPPPLGDTILADAKRRIGDRVCLIGNVQYDDIARGTPESVQQRVRTAIREGAPGGGFILSPCASPYESPLPPRAARNLIHFLRAGKRWGRYPISPDV